MNEQEELAYINRKFGSSVDSSGAAWGVTILPGDVVRYELRPGDVASAGDAAEDKERVELSQGGRNWAVGTPIEISYRMMIEPGPVNTAAWMVIAQMHTTNTMPPNGVALSPPFAMVMNGERMGVHIRAEADWNKPNIPAIQLYRDTADIVRGQWYDIRIELRLDAAAGTGGYVRVWRDGVQIVNYTGPLGYGTDTASYWKQGIYRRESNETFALQVDDLVVQGAADTFTGTAGDDVFTVDNPADAIAGDQGGIDEIRTRLLTYTLPAGVEKLTFLAAGQSHYDGTGNALDNTIMGEYRADTLRGAAGNDTVDGRDGADLLEGGSGHDSLSGWGAADTLAGGTGNDTLRGDGDADSLAGDAGDDSLGGGTGNDMLAGGTGNDTLVGDGDADSLVGDAGDDSLSGGAGGDTLRGGAENDTLRGGDSDDRLFGDEGQDSLRGDAGQDSLAGGAGDDTLGGDDGDDSLAGDDGNDSMLGGAGNDTLAGGAGQDSVQYAFLSGAGSWVQNGNGSWTITKSNGIDQLSGMETARFTNGVLNLSTGVFEGARLSVAATNASRVEGHSGSTGFTFTVTRADYTTVPVSVDWSVAGSGATPANTADFAGGVLPSGSVSFAAGETSKTITVNIAGDSSVEPAETFAVTLANPTNGATLTTASATGTILGDDAVLSLAAATASRPEGQSGWTPFTFTVQRDGGTSVAHSVNWAVTGSGTHPATGDDFGGGSLPSGTVTLNAGETSRTITVNVGSNTTIEPDEGFTVTLSGASTGATIGTATATGTILNDDATLVIAATDTAKAERQAGGSSTHVFTVTRAGDTSVAHSVSWAVSGTLRNPANAADFVGGVLPSGTLTFAAGETTKTISIQVAGDAAVEANERFNVTLSDAPAGVRLLTATATGHILNDDASFSIVDSAATRAEGSAGDTAFTFLVTRGGDFATTHSVNWAVTGSGADPANAADFAGGVLPSGTVTFAPEEINKSITIQVAGDSAAEPTERFTVALSNPSAGAVMSNGATAQGRIDNDDGAGGAPPASAPMTHEEEAALIARRYAAGVDSAQAPWSVSLPSDGIIRFEARAGDIWGDFDVGRNMERTEISQSGWSWATRTPIEINYRMMIEAGDPNTSSFVSIMQMHTENQLMPDGSRLGPMFMLTLTGETLTGLVFVNTDPDRSKPATSIQVVTSPPTMLRDQWYDIRVEMMLNAGGSEGEGYVRIWRDGVQIADYAGPVGRVGDTGGYFKQGIYRNAASETLAMQVADLAVEGAADTLIGTAGDDVFTVDSQDDVISGNQGGIDEVRTRLLEYALPNGVEKLTFLGGSNAQFTGTGNALDNTIIGWGRADLLDGGPGNDFLDGGAGADMQLGGDGADTLVANGSGDTLAGGAGNDVYVFEGSQPTITEAASGGIDEVRTSRFMDALPENIENLLLLGTQGTGNGNALANRLTGNEAANTLSGRAGADTLLGLAGTDTLRGEDGNDSLLGGADNDNLGGGADNDSLAGDTGADTLRGDDGNDSLLGEADSDNLGGGAGDDMLSGDAGADTLAGDGGADTLVGGAGADSLSGGAGNDLAVFAAGDIAADDAFAGGSDTDTADFHTHSIADITAVTLTSVETLLLRGAVTLTQAQFAQATSFDGRGNGFSLVGATAGRYDLAAKSFTAGFAGLTGSAGADTLVGGAGADTLRGGLGDDSVSGGAGHDSLFGDAGADTLRGEDGSDSLFGGADNDSLGGGNDNDSLAGDAGADTLRGDDGNDTLLGGADSDNLGGGAGNDSLAGDAGADTLRGEDGNDSLLGGADNDSLAGGIGDDSLTGDIGADTLRGEDGNDTLLGGADSDNLGGGAGTDSLVGDAGADTLAGDGGADTLLGGAGADSLAGGLGNDLAVFAAGDIAAGEAFAGDGDTDTADFHTHGIADISGVTLTSVETLLLRGSVTLTQAQFAQATSFDGRGDGFSLVGATAGRYDLAAKSFTAGFAGLTGSAGADTLVGGAAADTLRGALGDDSLSGGTGDDSLFGDAGADTLRGEDGNDSLFGGADNDSLGGGNGHDSLFGDAGADTLRGEDGNDSLLGGADNDSLAGGIGDDSLAGDAGADTLRGDDGNDTLLGGADSDNLGGGAGTDSLVGDAGADTLAGDGGADTLLGGAGADSLAGGSGNDLAVFAAGDIVAGEAFAGDGDTDTADFHTHGIADISGVTLTSVETLLLRGAVTLTQAQFAQATSFDGRGDGFSLVGATAARYEIAGKSFTAGFAGLTGSAGADTLVGGAGADTLRGALGDDSLVGSAGNDLLFGDAGSDSVQYAFLGGAGVWTKQSDGSWTIAKSGGGTDSLRGIETARFTNGVLDLATGIFDGITLSIAGASATRAEGQSGNTAFTFTVTRTAYTAVPVSVDWAVAGSGANPADAADFGGTAPSGTVSFAAGETTKTISINVSGNTVVEPEETFTVTLSGPTAAAQITTAIATGTILNDDASLGILATDAAKAEGQAGATTPFTFTVTRTGDTSVAHSVNWAVSGSAVNAADFGTDALPSGTVSFAVGETAKTIALAVAGDTAVESAEAFTVTLSGATTGAIIGTATATGSIQNDDATLSIAATSAAQVEGNGGSVRNTFTVTRAGDTSVPHSVTWAVAGSGTNPANGADFAGGALPGGTLTFAAGETTRTIVVNVEGDEDLEATEGYSVTLSNPSSGAVITNAAATGSIITDDSTFSIAPVTPTVTEGDSDETNLAFRVTREGGTATRQIVAWGLEGTGASPVSGSDFFNNILPGGTLNFEVGVTTMDIVAFARGDTTAETDETFTVTLRNSNAGTTIVNGAATGSILTDDAGFAIVATDAARAEGQSGGTPFAFTVTRTGHTGTTHSVNWAVTGTSSAPASAADFVGSALPGGTLSFAAGETSKTITVNVAGDSADEVLERFAVTLSGASAGATIAAGTAEGRIFNDDAATGTGAAASFSIAAADASKAEGQTGTTPFTFTVTRTGATNTSHSVVWAVTGSGDNPATGEDFGGTLPAGTLTFNSGETSRTISVGVSTGTVVEPNQGFTVTLTGGTAGVTLGTAAANGTILNDDAAFAIAATDAIKAEGQAGTTPFTFTVTRTGDIGTAHSVNWAVTTSGTNRIQDSDLVGGALPTGTLSFAAGETSKTITVAVAGDVVGEADERFTVTLSGASTGATITTATATGTVISDDSNFAIADWEATRAEGQGDITAFTFVVARGGAYDTLQTVTWSVAGSGPNAANAADFAGGVLPTGTVTFAPGETRKFITIDVAGETAVEPTESFSVTLSSPTNGAVLAADAISAQGWILDDDTTGVVGALPEAAMATEQAERSLMRSKFGVDLHNSGAPWAFTLLPGDIHRYEARPGDIYHRDAGRRADLDRSEIYYTEDRAMPAGVPMEITYRMMFEPGEDNTHSPRIIIGQMYPTTGAMPPGGQELGPVFGLTLTGNRLGAYVISSAGYSVEPDTTTIILADTTDLVRGQWYDMRIEALIEYPVGYVRIWRDGALLVDFNGPVGRADETGATWKQGLYRGTSSVTVAMQIDDLVIQGAADSFTGAAGNDVFTVDNPADAIVGDQGGIDEIRTRVLDYTLPAGVERLSFYAVGSANVTGRGNALDNTITGDANADSLMGDLGNDLLTGGAGTDRLSGDAGADTLAGDGGADTLLGGAGADSLSGGTGNDLAVFAAGDIAAGEAFTGDAGTDTADFHTHGIADITAVTLTSVETLLLRGSVTLTQAQFAQATSFDGRGDGFSLVGATAARYDLAGKSFAAGFAGLTGSAGADTLVGGAGADTLRGGLGDDSVSGGNGHDSLSGDAGADTLRGEDGADTLLGGAGADSLSGGAGNDLAVFAAGDIAADEAFAGGSDTDTADFHTHSIADITAVTLTSVETLLLRGAVTLTQAQFAQATSFDGRGNGFSLVGATAGRYDLAAKSFTAGFAGLTGSAGADTLVGGAGADTLRGALGDDSLSGGNGHDSLSGGTGNDTLAGGAGSDTIVFSGARADYTITVEGVTSLRVTDSVAGRDGSDLLVDIGAADVEYLSFADGLVSVTGGAQSYGDTVEADMVEADVNGDDGSLATMADLDRNARADLLLRGPAGEVMSWNVDGTSVTAAAMLANPGTYWSLAGTGDFDFDGRDDILLRGAGGEVGVWMLDGPPSNADATIASPGIGWSPVGTGDFNADGRDDILLRGAGGEVGVWMMDGPRSTAGVIVGNPGVDWSPVATGDFNADGRDDILLRGTAGEVRVWMMEGTHSTADVIIANPGTDWSIAGTGDTNRDGRDDILLRSAAGEVRSWTMNGPSITSSTVLTQATDYWQLAGA